MEGEYESLHQRVGLHQAQASMDSGDLERDIHVCISMAPRVARLVRWRLAGKWEFRLGSMLHAYYSITSSVV